MKKKLVKEDKKIKFYDISDYLLKVLYKFENSRIDSVDDVFSLDKDVKEYLKSMNL